MPVWAMENIIKLTDPVWAVVTNKKIYIEGVDEGAQREGQLMTGTPPCPTHNPRSHVEFPV